MVRILFVCTGNTCRSPMAEALLREKLGGNGAACKVNVSSAGILAWEGQPASQEAVAVMAQRGLSLASHRSRQVNAAQVSESDLILTMTCFHKERLRQLFAGHADKVLLLSEYAGAGGDVIDPAGSPMSEYQMCAAELDLLIEAAVEKILLLAGKKQRNGEK